MSVFLTTRVSQSFCSVTKTTILPRTRTIFFFVGILCMLEVRPVSLAVRIAVPIMTISALMFALREFPHRQSKEKQFNEKPYSQFGNGSFYVLHLHGWGKHADADSFTKQPGDDICIISPRFSETKTHKIFCTSFGQDPDVLIALQSLKATHQATKKINTVAHCRGTTVFFNTILALSIPDHPLCITAGINNQERIVILEKIKKGKSIMIAPLMGVHEFLTHWSFAAFAGVIQTYILPWLTRYQFDSKKDNVITQIESWNTSEIPIIIIFPEFDDFIGTAYRNEFAEALQQKNGIKNTKIIFIPGEKRHWPFFLKQMPYLVLFDFATNTR
jgi:hypothetical protein